MAGSDEDFDFSWIIIDRELCRLFWPLITIDWTKWFRDDCHRVEWGRRQRWKWRAFEDTRWLFTWDDTRFCQPVVNDCHFVWRHLLTQARNSQLVGKSGEKVSRRRRGRRWRRRRKRRWRVSRKTNRVGIDAMCKQTTAWELTTPRRIILESLFLFSFWTNFNTFDVTRILQIPKSSERTPGWSMVSANKNPSHRSMFLQNPSTISWQLGFASI